MTGPRTFAKVGMTNRSPHSGSDETTASGNGPAEIERATRRLVAALDALEGPGFAYCRSGTRCTNLYALVQERKQG